MTDTYLTRQTLLKRLKSNTDELAWEDFVFYYQNFIYSIIIRMGVSQADRDDISQKVLLKIWRSLDQFDHNQQKGHFRSWINAITRNTVLSFIAHSKHLDKKYESFKVNADGAFVAPEVDKLIGEEWEKHVSALAFDTISKKMSPQAIDAFLAGLRNEPVSETAERLGLEENTVYTYKLRVKRKIVAEIKNLKDMLE